MLFCNGQAKIEVEHKSRTTLDDKGILITVMCLFKATNFSKPVFTTTNKFTGNIGQFCFIQRILVDIKSHNVVQPWLTHSTTKVGLHSLQSRKASFTGCISRRQNKDQTDYPANLLVKSL